MRTHVTVVPSDKIISVDGRAIQMDFSALTNIHAIQWHNGKGHVEYNDGTYNTELTEEDYGTIIFPYVALWVNKAAELDAPGPPETLEGAKAAKTAEVLAAYNEAFSAIDKVYPSFEREGWSVQQEEATAILANPNAEAPVLSILVELRGKGETITELANKVIANAEHWRNTYAVLTGQQQRMYWEVSKLTTVEAVKNYEVKFDMDITYVD